MAVPLRPARGERSAMSPRDKPDREVTVADQVGLRRAVVSGLAWKGTSQIATQVIRLVVAIALARLLTRHEYGVAGMVLVFLSFVLVFADIGLGNALVQRLELSDEDRSTAFWTATATGVFFTIGGVALSGPIARFFHEPSLRPMIAVLSISFLLQALALTQSALLVRLMAFGALERREMAGAVCGGAVGIGIALAGFGAWAIVAQQLTTAAVGTLLVWIYSPWRPQRRFSHASLRSLAGFTSNVFGAGFVTQLRGTTDNILVGRVLGASALGAYALAYNLVLLPFNRIAIPLAQVLFPALSRLQHDAKRVAGYWIRALRMITAVTLPVCIGLVVVAPDGVVVVLGEKWESAVPIVQLLSIVGLLQTLQFLNPVVLQAVDRTSILFRWTLVTYLASVAGFVAGLHWGAVGVAAGYAIATALVEPLYFRATARTVGVRVRDLARPLIGITGAGAVMGAVAVLARWATLEAGLGQALRMVAVVAVGALVYLVACQLLAPELLAEVRLLLRRRNTADDGPSEDEARASSHLASTSAVS